MGIIQGAIIWGWGQLSGGQLSGGGGNYPRWELSGGQLAGGQLS